MKLEKLIEKSNLTEKEVCKIIKSLKDGKPKNNVNYKLPFDSERVKFGVISDLHIGHKNYRNDILEYAIKKFDYEKVNFVCIPGDILEGMSGREGHIYELKEGTIGASNQINYGVSELSKINQPIYAITATNSHDGWFSSKNDLGLEVGPELDRRIKNFNFLGYDEADLITNKGLIIRMTHPGDGTAYAISYKMQKYLNSLSGGMKPHILLQGHYHKSEYLFYRNVHGFDVGCLQDQTIFMKKKQTPAMLGFWVIDVVGDKGGVDSLKCEFTPFYN